MFESWELGITESVRSIAQTHVGPKRVFLAQYKVYNNARYGTKTQLRWSISTELGRHNC